jgi:hypothetical protein
VKWVVEGETRLIGNGQKFSATMTIPDPCFSKQLPQTQLHHRQPSSRSNLTMAAELPPSRIRVLSLNCWGLKFIAKQRYERLEEIGNQIAAADPRPDIVGLQECWTQHDYDVIREKTRSFLPHGKFYYSGCFGGGLVILSRWPFEESNMVRYPLNGRPAAFYRGDWFVGKGVACARLRIGPGRRDIAEVFTTHVRRVLPVLGCDFTDWSSFTPPTRRSRTIRTYATALRKPGRSRSSCAPPPSADTW